MRYRPSIFPYCFFFFFPGCCLHAPPPRYETNRDQRWIHKAANVMHELIVQLSRFYARLMRDLEQEPWQPPASFSRKSVKYWVPAEHVTALKLFVIKHLPILELTKSEPVGPDFHLQKVSKKSLHQTMVPSSPSVFLRPPPFSPTKTDQSHNYISSIYLDNDDLDVYNIRVRRLQGGQLLRVRWYGGEMLAGDSLPTPGRKATIFVERKTHNQRWTGEVSKKDRFPLDLPLLPGYLSGELSAEKVFEIMLLQGSISAGNARAQLELAKDCQRTILSMGQGPMVRTVFHRTAFQSASSNEVRVSLDFPCYFVKETDRPNFWADLRCPGAVNPFESGIVEIKTADDTVKPPWISQLLAQGWLSAVPKFSKFQTAMATFYPSKCSSLPYWVDSVTMEHNDQDESGGSPTEDRAEGDKVEGEQESKLGGQRTSSRRKVQIATPPPAEQQELAADPQIDAAPSTGLDLAETMFSSNSEQPLVSPDATRPSRRVSEQRPAPRRTSAPAVAVPTQQRRRSTLTDFGAGASADNFLNYSLPASNSDTSAFVRRATTTADSAAQPAAPGRKLTLRKSDGLSKSKIEPDTLFANERTFINWLSAAILLATLSTAIMGLGETARLAGTIFFPVALVFMFYALFLFQWRLRKIKSRDGSRFDDPYGPWLLTIFLSLALVGVVVVYWTQDVGGNASGSTGGSSSGTGGGGSSTSSGGRSAADYNADSRNFAASSVLTPRSFADFATDRYSSNCAPTPLTSTAWPVAPTTWLLRQPLSAADYSSSQNRYSALLRLESRLSKYVDMSEAAATVAWQASKTVYCVPQLYSCDGYQLWYRPFQQQLVLRYRQPGAGFSPYQLSSSSQSQGYSATSAFVAESSCTASTVMYYVFTISGVASMTAISTTAHINALLTSPAFPASAPLSPLAQQREATFGYVLPSLAGARAEAWVDVEYPSESQLALGANARSAVLSVAVSGSVSDSSLAQADGLVYYLSHNTASSNAIPTGTIVGIGLGSLLLVCLLVAVGYRYRQHRRNLAKKRAAAAMS